jgi:hypothetical protein
MNFLKLVVFGLATWRLASLLSSEQGPLGICSKFRTLAGIKFERGQDIPQNKFASDLMCTWCMTLYTGIFWSMLNLINTDVAFYIALPFALSTIGILVMTSKTLQIYLKHLKDG